jgi:hypothetical protein
VRDEPEEKRERDTEEQTGDDGKVESGVFAAVNDVAGQFSEAEGKLVSEIEKSPEKNEKTCEEKKRAAEFTERVHEVILPEGANKPPQSVITITTEYLSLT